MENTVIGKMRETHERMGVPLSPPYETLRGCDALIVVTEWDEFRNPDMKMIKSLLKKPVIVDGRNIYDPKEMKKLGFTYIAIGR